MIIEVPRPSQWALEPQQDVSGIRVLVAACLGASCRPVWSGPISSHLGPQERTAGGRRALQGPKVLPGPKLQLGDRPPTSHTHEMLLGQGQATCR